MKDMEIFKIGDKVIKKSDKPFKSGQKTNTVKGFCINPNDPKHSEALLFEEDDSFVNTYICEVIDSNELNH